MYTSGECADFPSYANADTARYARTVKECHSVGTIGASIVRFECDAGEYPREATSDFALTMVENGGFAAEFDFGAGRFSANVSPGQLFLSPPFTATHSEFHGTAKGVVLAVAYARVAALLHDVVSTPDKGLFELYVRPLCDDFIRSAVHQLLATAQLPKRVDSLFADAAILAILATLARLGAQREVKAKRGLADWQLRRVMEKLESMQDISLAGLASVANLSPYHFARAFKQTTGLPPHHFQLMRRIERAKELLTSTHLSVTEVALGVGYGSSQTLARAFRKEVGTTPIDYRRSTTA
jgi:AraC-type DNA-binding domain-containing proteins